MSMNWQLTLFVAGSAPESQRARENLNALVGKYLTDNDVQVSVCDLLDNPRVARERNILALPTLIRDLPGPESRVVGDLTDTERLWSALQAI